MNRSQLKPASKWLSRQLKNKTLKILFEEERARTDIARMIRTARERAGLSQRELAAKANTTQAVVARLELGSDKRMPSLSLISRLLSAAGATLELSCKFSKVA